MSDPWNDYSSEVDADMGNEVAAPEQDKKVTPVKLGRGATAGLVVTFVFIFVIFWIYFHRTGRTWSACNNRILRNFSSIYSTI